VTLFCPGKDNEGNKGEANASMKDIVQENKGQETIDTVDSYDAS
jgi:hypothetical protein